MYVLDAARFVEFLARPDAARWSVRCGTAAEVLLRSSSYSAPDGSLVRLADRLGHGVRVDPRAPADWFSVVVHHGCRRFWHMSCIVAAEGKLGNAQPGRWRVEGRRCSEGS